MKLMNTIGTGLAGMALLAGSVDASKYVPVVDKNFKVEINGEFSYNGQAVFRGFTFSRYVSSNSTKYIGVVNNRAVAYEIDYKNKIVWKNGIPVEDLGVDLE